MGWGADPSLRKWSGGTAVPRSLASAASPMLAGSLLAVSGFGWPLLIAGALKIVYDILLLVTFRKIRPPEER
ncbi:hypothetical protein B5V02_33095 [Mesorhizobium kowhaii]|uniref:MFS transporter n=1 Tax=Mesorhizobium kowhaii TaxID=1300272 RepID=A0A2W7BWG4_9HYPH|nr:hypothetical protein B5V02_33095 [Mesorhizobium kowhaii]